MVVPLISIAGKDSFEGRVIAEMADLRPILQMLLVVLIVACE